MKITKMHGLGNSQIIIENLYEDIEYKTGLSYNEIAIALCHPGFGIGSDQTLIILPGEKTDYKMRIFNKDGSEAEMCGNGIRCVARYLFDENLISNNSSIETKAGIREVKIIHEKILNGNEVSIEVSMGKGMILEDNKKIDKFKGTHVSIGNPHFVIFTDKASRELIIKEGPKLENAVEFQPDKVNVEFARLINENIIEAYVWERGSGLTLACGTGACATALAANNKGLIESEVKVRLLGGELKIRLSDDNQIQMIGPAEYILKGEVMNIKNIYQNIRN